MLLFKYKYKMIYLYNILSNYKQIRSYASGDIIPKFRGFIHFYISITIVIFFMTSVFVNYNMDISMYFFLLGKTFCYGTSSLFHSGYFLNVDNHLRCLKADKIGIYISNFSSAIPFCKLEKNQFFIINYTVLFFGIISILLDYEIMRKIILGIQTTYLSLFIGNQIKYNNLWKYSMLFYYLSLVSFIPSMIENNNTTKMVDSILPVFWHKKGIYGCHEDFHFLLLIGDILCFINGYRYTSMVKKNLK